MPVVEYTDPEDNEQENNQAIGVQRELNNICWVRDDKSYDTKPVKLPCTVCLNHHPEFGTEAPLREQEYRLATPLHASQVPQQDEYVVKLFQRYPVMWQGLMALKNDLAAVQMHFLFGNPNLARDALPYSLEIYQRMRMEPTQLDGLAKKMENPREFCMLFALPCGQNRIDVLFQAANLKMGFIIYFQQKQAAGIINVRNPRTQQIKFVILIFPTCEFTHNTLNRIAPDMYHRISDIPHVLIIVAAV